MKHLDELVSEAFAAGELKKVKPQRIDENAVLERARGKLDGRYETGSDLEPLDPEALAYAKPKRPRKHRAAFSALGVAAACLVCVFMLNFVAPTAAEAIPGVGRLFHMINSGRVQETPYNAVNLSLVEERMAAVTDAAPVTLEGDLELTVKEAFYDGSTLYCAAELKTALDPNAEDSAWEYQFTVNGKELDFDYRLMNRGWKQAGENTYVSDDLSTHIPEEFRPRTPGDLRVKCVAEFMDLSKKKTVFDLDGQEIQECIPATLGKAQVEFTAAYDPSDMIAVTGDAEQNGVKFISLTSSPASTEIILDFPEGMGEDLWGARHFTTAICDVESGRPLCTLNSGSTNYSPAKGYLRETDSGEGLPEGTEKLLVKAYSYSTGGFDTKERLEAEFLVDLRERTVTAK